MPAHGGYRQHHVLSGTSEGALLSGGAPVILAGVAVHRGWRGSLPLPFSKLLGNIFHYLGFQFSPEEHSCAGALQCYTRENRSWDMLQKRR